MKASFRDSIPIVESAEVSRVIVGLLPSCTTSVQVSIVVTLKFICASLRNKDICCEVGLMGWLLSVMDRFATGSEVLTVSLSLVQVLGRHRATPSNVRHYLSLMKSAHAARDAKRLSALLAVCKAMTKHLEPSKVFDFDGSPEGGIFIPPFKIGSNGYTISFWMSSDAVSTEHAGREQRLLSMLNDLGDGLILSLMPQRRASHTILCAAMHSKNNVTTQVFESTQINHHKWFHVTLVHTPSRLFQRRSELKLYLNGQFTGAKSLAYLDVTRPFSKSCWGTDASMATELAPPGQSLRGQLTMLAIFNEALSDEKIASMYAILPDEAKAMLAVTETQNFISLYHPHIPPGDIVYDLNGSRHGIRFGSLRIIRSMSLRESIHHLGGIELFFPFLFQLDQFVLPHWESHMAETNSWPSTSTEQHSVSQLSPTSSTSTATSSPSSISTTSSSPKPISDSTLASDVLETMANVIHNSSMIKASLLHSKHIMVLGLIFERIPVELLDIHLLQALGSFIGALASHDEDELSNVGLKYLLWNPRIWTRPSFEIQQQHHKFLLAHIQTKRVYFRHYFGIPFLLELLRSYPHTVAPLSGTPPSSSPPPPPPPSENTSSTTISIDIGAVSNSASASVAISSSSTLSSSSSSSSSLAMQTVTYTSPAQLKALLAGLPPVDLTPGIHTLSSSQITDLRLVILRMMEIETEYVLNYDEMFALLGVMTTSEETCEALDAAKFLLACLHQEPKHNYQVLSDRNIGGFYALLPMLESKEESVRLVCVQLLRAVLSVMEERERSSALSQIAVALSLALSSFPFTLSTYYALMALLLGDSVGVDWRCDFRVKSGTKGDLVARIIGFPDLDGSQKLRHPEVLHIIFELLGKSDQRGSGPPEAQGWELVVRVLQDFRLLLAQRPPDQHQRSSHSSSQGARPSTHAHFRNWAVFQHQPDWLDLLLLLYVQASEFTKLSSSDLPMESSTGSTSSSDSGEIAPKDKNSSVPGANEAFLAQDMLENMMNSLLLFPVLELKDGWKVVQSAEVAVHRFSESYNSHSKSGIPFEPLKFLKHMYRSLLRNLKIELDRLFGSGLAPQKYSHFWENVTHLSLLVEEFLFYQPRVKSNLTIKDVTNAADAETINKQNSQQLRAHMHRSSTIRYDIGPSAPKSSTPPSSSTTTTAIGNDSTTVPTSTAPQHTSTDENNLSGKVQQVVASSSSSSHETSTTSAASSSSSSSSTSAAPILTISGVNELSSGDSSFSTKTMDSLTSGLSVTNPNPPTLTLTGVPMPVPSVDHPALLIAPTPHLRLSGNNRVLKSGSSIGKWNDFDVAVALFELLDYLIPHTQFSKTVIAQMLPNEPKPSGPTAGDMLIIDTWARVETSKDWSKEKHKILLTVIRTLVTTLFDAELILDNHHGSSPSPPSSSSSSTPSPLPPSPTTSSSTSATTATTSTVTSTAANLNRNKEGAESDPILKRREVFFIQSILRLHRLVAMIAKTAKVQTPTSPPLAGLAFAISSVQTLSGAIVAQSNSDPPFIEIVLFCASKLMKLVTQACDHPSYATNRLIDVIKDVLSRWVDLGYFDNAMPAMCPEANPFLERKHVFDKKLTNEAILAFIADMGRAPRHQLWRARILKAVQQVEQGAVSSIRPMMARRSEVASNYNAALEKVRIERTNDAPIHKNTRVTNQKIANAFYATSSQQRQEALSQSESTLRRFYRLWHQLHESASVWRNSLLTIRKTTSGRTFCKLDKSEQRPRMRRKVKHNFLGTQHLTATHAYHKQQWAKERELRRKASVSSPPRMSAAAATAATSASGEIPISTRTSSSFVSPPLSPSPSFVDEAKSLPLSHSKSSESEASSPANATGGGTSSKLVRSVRDLEGDLISADNEIDLMMDEVNESDFKDIDTMSAAHQASGSSTATTSSSAAASSASSSSSSTLGSGSMQSGQPISHLHGDKVLYSSPCELILPEVKILGRIFVTEHRIIFEYDEANAQVIDSTSGGGAQGSPSSPRSQQLSASMVGVKDIGYFNWTRTLFKHKFCDRVWKVQNLIAIFCRRYMLSWTAVELAFENNGKNFFINLPKDENKRLFGALEALRPPKLRPSLFSTAPQYFRRMNDVTERWRRREISNFDYLVYLNHAASRTVNDLTQYPVFPWVLTNYTSDHLDLNDPDNYRDLTKPIGALEPNRLEKFVERYENFVDDSIPRFHYGSHYSSAGAVLFYLLRLEPFTTQFICLQGGKFDYPDRLFSSVAESWENCLRSTTDVKELIPEFFYMPEFLMNQNELDLGQKTHAASPIDNVILPPWAKGSAHEFVRIHREALESEYVSANLHHWIDLIFGFKQRGREAVAAFNTFFHVTYEGEIDLEALISLEQKQAMLSQIENFGQTPAQLLTTPHPPRDSSLRERQIQMFPDLAHAPRPSLPQLMTRVRQATSRLPFSTSYDLFALSKTHLLTINAFGEYLLHKWESKPVPISFMNTQSDVTCTLELDTLFSTNASPISFPKDPTQPILRASLADAFLHRLIPGNKRFQTQCLGPVSNTFGHSIFIYEPFPEDTNYIISAGHWDGSVNISLLDEFVGQNYPVLAVRQSLAAHRSTVTCMAISEGYLVTGSQDTTAKLWTLTYERKQLKIGPTTPSVALYTISTHATPLTAVAISKPLDLIITADSEGTMMIHQLDSKRNRTREVIRHPGAISNLVITPAGYIVTYCPRPQLLYCYSLNGELLAEKNLFDGEETEFGLSQIVASRNSRLVLCAEGSTIVFRSAPSLDIIHILYADNTDSNIVTLKLSDDERTLFAGYKDGALTYITLPDWSLGCVDL